MGCTTSQDIKTSSQGQRQGPQPISKAQQAGQHQQNGHVSTAQHSQPQAANRFFPVQQNQQPQTNPHFHQPPPHQQQLPPIQNISSQGTPPPIGFDMPMQTPLPPIQSGPSHHPPQSSPATRPPPHYGWNTEVTEKTDIQVRNIKVDRDILLRYIELEKEICAVESKNVLKALKVKEEELAELKKRVSDLENTHQASMQATAKEKADVDQLQEPSIKQFLEEKGQFDQALTKEQEEYLEALNKQEIIKKELEGARQTYSLVTNEVTVLQSEAAKITELYKQQDELLAGIFDGKYGSELEFQLESQLDTLLDRKQRVGVAKYKWQNGRVLLQHAVDQLGHTVKKWVELQNLRPENVQVRYTVATEARNSLVAAHQNIVSAQRYLVSIQFPYCKPAELDTLQRATSNIYTDMQTPDRHSHALNCYNVTHRRAGALLQWFDYVIENTIMKDLERSAVNVATKEQELRRERLKLIKGRIQEQMGDSVNLDVQKEIDELQKQTEEQGMIEGGGQIAGGVAVMSEDEVKTAQPQAKPEESETDGPTTDDEAMAPIDLAELAPPPTMDDLFGNIDELRKQHDREMEEFEKTQQLNKERIDQGLQDKLRARQSRRKRQIAQEQPPEPNA